MTAHTYSRVAAEQELGATDESRVADALLQITMHDPDRDWVRETLIAHALVAARWPRAVALTCLGHQVRIDGVVEWSRVGPVLRRAVETGDALLVDRADHAAWDMHAAVGIPTRQEIDHGFRSSWLTPDDAGGRVSDDPEGSEGP